MSEDSTTEFDTLVARLGVPSPRKREPALARLGELGDPAIDHLVDRLRDGDPHTRYLVARAFGRSEFFEGLHERADVADALVAALEDDHSPVRNRAARALELFGDPRAEPILLRWFESGDEVIRFRAVSTLIACASRSRTLLRAVDDPSVKIRRAAVGALTRLRIKDGPVVERIYEVLRDDPDDEVRGHAARYVGEIDNQYWRATAALHRALTDPASGEETRTGAIKGLAAQAAVRGPGPIVASAPDLVATLTAQLADPWYAIRFAAVEALERLGSPDVVAPLWRMVTDPRALVRGCAVNALMSLRADGVLPVACRIVRSDPDYFARELVATGLARIGGDEAISALRAALGDEVGFVRHKALQSLVALLGRGALDDVRAATRDPDEFNRNEAAGILTMLGGDPA